MNDLSWMLYLAGVSEGVSVLFVFTGLIAVVAFVGVGAAGLSEGARWGPPLLKRATPAAFALVLVGILIPPSNTIYAIAASEIGEKALNTPTATKAMKAIDAWLDRQIAGASDE